MIDYNYLCFCEYYYRNYLLVAVSAFPHYYYISYLPFRKHDYLDKLHVQTLHLSLCDLQVGDLRAENYHKTFTLLTIMIAVFFGDGAS